MALAGRSADRGQYGSRMSRNIFLLGRQRGDEDQLTEMLVWLISAVPQVSRALVQLAFGDIDVDLGKLDVTTQHPIPGRRLDALLKSESLVLVIESKLDSVYGDGQLRAYINWLATEHKNAAHKALMTLTKSAARWPARDLAHAAQLDVVASTRRWHELYTALSSLTTPPDELPARLAHEFLDMLHQEQLIPAPSDPGWDEQRWFALLTKRRGEDETQAARDLYEWTSARNWWHTFAARSRGTWMPLFWVDDRDYAPIAFNTSGRITFLTPVGGQPPFDRANARFELLKRVNQIPGVNYDPQEIHKPDKRSALSALASNDAGLERLKRVLEWIEAEARKTA
jgi:hypothetical protein